VFALLVHHHWAGLILEGIKTWEIRGSRTARRGPIALLVPREHLLVGTCELVDVQGPLSRAMLLSSTHLHYIPPGRLAGLPYATPYAWVLARARPLAKPLPYRPPRGAIRWVRLPGAIASQLEA